MSLARLYAWRILFHYWLSRHLPPTWRTWVNDMALGLVSASWCVPPMSIFEAPAGAWLGQAACENMNCKLVWRIFSEVPLDEDDELICPGCDQLTAGII